MDISTLNQIHAAGLVTDEQRSSLSRIIDRSTFSVFRELRAVLATGVLIFAAGAGTIVYRNIDSIGHLAIIGALTLLAIGSSLYAAQGSAPFAKSAVPSRGLLKDYSLLLGCLLIGIVVHYAQYEYAIFGSRWDLASLLPALLYLFAAYRFDHRGVLSLGVTGLATWVGLTVSPVEMIKSGVFNTDGLIVTGMVFGAIAIGAGLGLERAGIKKHFTGTWMLFGANILLLACLAAEFTFSSAGVYAVVVCGLCVAGVLYARSRQSFFFLLMSCVYSYIAVTRVIVESHVLTAPGAIALYFVVSCIGMVLLILKYKRLLGLR